ncbi:uncharacterized protein B0P05DRAFT_69992 [Gilbertella persicaria]|uniref:uncharacterized protein n=1 Tax=Gilbertella persicaria TaxID=101096 RepID=UPI0022202A1C|nr:uncharacterized protein B0P05DRAFT_69992 [Gilbertella persicaria]KAI8080691.1 hypothetical protein B0P05DRAFT_69992 [Gilbertella persicaria]
MTAIQQIIMAIPHLVQNSTQSSILSKVLATYIQYLTTLNSSAIASSSSSMNALPPSPSTNSSNNSPIKEPVDNMLNADTSVLHTIQPTKPRMEITVIDNIAVCIAFLVKDDIEYRIMRRLDNSFINGTQLLIAGGIDTESERSMILSFEMNRVRMPNRQSVLFGTWIPNRRAQELAATCSIQHMLTSFLGDDVEHLFPSPLPSFIANNKRRSRKNSLTATEDTAAATRNHHLAALTLAALKNPVVISDPHKTEIDRMTTTIDKNMPLTHPSRTLKSTTEYTLKAPHLGYFENTYDDNGKHVVVIDKSVSTTVDLNFIKQDENDSSDVDIETMEEFEHEGDTDTDNDIEQVRKEMRRVRDAAIAAMELDDILKMNYAEHRRKSDGQVRNDRPKKKRKVFSETEDDEDHSIPYRAFDFQRKRPVGFISGGGKWSASTGNNNTFKSSKIKRSATWHGKMTPTSNHKKQQKTETTLKQNTTAIIQKPSTSKHKAIQAVITHTLVDENDEGDEIDIGGSDNDDDLR